MMLTRPAMKISTPDYIETSDSHNPTCLAKAIGLLHLYIVGLMAIVWVSYRYQYTRGSGQVINNGTNINARYKRSNSLNWG